MVKKPSILLAFPESKYSQELSLFLNSANYDTDITLSGKDCQGKIYKNDFSFCVLDFALSDHSSIQVLRYLKQSAPTVKVIFTVQGRDLLKQAGFEIDDLINWGASEVLVQPFTNQMLLAAIERDSLAGSWKVIEASSTTKKDEEEINALDRDFTKIPITDFFSGSTTIYDCFIKLAPNKYLKIIHQGDVFDQDRLNRYANEKSIEYLYFKTKERGKFINFTNQILEKAISEDKGSAQFKTNTARNLSEKYIEEIYTQGIRPQLIDEGKKVCENISNMIRRETRLDALLSEYREYDKGEHGHLFLTSFFAAIICKNLDWATSRTIETVAMAGLLHDIGKMKLPTDLRTLRQEDMSKDQFAQYIHHASHGEFLLRNYDCIGEPVRQIIYQHHETIDGSGFPHGLSGIKIYPLAKVVALADTFSKLLMHQKMTPLEGLKDFFSRRETLLKYDPLVIKALIKGFSRNEKR